MFLKLTHQLTKATNKIQFMKILIFYMSQHIARENSLRMALRCRKHVGENTCHKLHFITWINLAGASTAQYICQVHILIIVERDATQSSLFIILQVHSTCFGCQPHPSSGVNKTVTTASGTGHILCAATSLQRGQVGHVGGR